MSNWNENIDSPNKCTVCGYYKYDIICDCPVEFRELQCKSMEEKYYNCVDENGNTEYNSLKELMLKQLKESIKWDCSPYTPYKEEKVPIEEWIEVRIKLAKRDLDYHTKEFQEETRRIAENNNYLKGLYDALDKVEPLT